MPNKYSETQLILAAGAEGVASRQGSGFLPMEKTDAIAHFQQAGIWFGPRAILEETERFRQIIPYVVLQVGSRFVRYTRTAAGSEARLHGRVSVGLGGHVDLSDVVTINTLIDLPATLDRAAEREVLEELGEVDCVRKQWIGVILDDATPVSRVHVGFVALWHLRAMPDSCAEDAIGQISAETITDLLQKRNQLEKWSEIMLSYFSMK